jgi:formylglycine-generating enzyme required for sulfatase activity
MGSAGIIGQIGEPMLRRILHAGLRVWIFLFRIGQRSGRPLARFDRIPFEQALGLGLVVGWAVASVSELGSFPGLGGSVAAIFLAVWLFWFGQPAGLQDEAIGLPEMVPIPGGSFLMGSSRREPERGPAEKQRSATVSPFWIGLAPVARGEYWNVEGLGEIPFSNPRLPVTRVSWFEAVAFCNRLSQREGLLPCYRIEGDRVEWDREADGYRLPTEAEWEYAARAGTSTPWSCGDEPADLERYAWFRDNSQNRVHEVATRDPNPWGLHDMHGNVLEWCWDAFAKDADPGRGTARILRGGMFFSKAGGLRSAYRYWDLPGIRSGSVSFRCARGPARPG